jgi:hypothetical protein
LHRFAQLEQRTELAKATHQIAVFTQGMIAMEKTLVGIKLLDPRVLLEEGNSSLPDSRAPLNLCDDAQVFASNSC